MKVNVLRLDHRLKRDTRITTHVCLTARAFGASKIYLAGERDNGLMENVRDTASRFGGNFEIEYTESYMGVINKWKADGGKVVHLTMYGSQAHEIAPEVREDLKNNLTEGATLYRDNKFLLTRSHSLCTIAPGGSEIIQTSQANNAFAGIPRWESGYDVLVCNFVNRFVSKIDTRNFASPSLTFTESTVGYPEPGIFWNGKCVVPCGYQGLLVEK